MIPYPDNKEIWLLVVDTVLRQSGKADGSFHSSAFLRSAKERYRLEKLPGHDWATKVLGGLEFVANVPGYSLIWRYTGDLSRMIDADGYYAPWRHDLRMAFHELGESCREVDAAQAEWYSLAETHGTQADAIYGEFVRLPDGECRVRPGDGRVTSWTEAGKPPLTNILPPEG